MNILLFITAIILLLLAHIIKILRQAQFIEIYEEPKLKVLSKALSITFLLNLILPFKLGNIFRIIYSGKYMKNGKSFSAATIFIDILIDFFVITFIDFLFGLCYNYKNIAYSVKFNSKRCLCQLQ